MWARDTMDFVNELAKRDKKEKIYFNNLWLKCGRSITANNIFRSNPFQLFIATLIIANFGPNSVSSGLNCLKTDDYCWTRPILEKSESSNSRSGSMDIELTRQQVCEVFGNLEVSEIVLHFSVLIHYVDQIAFCTSCGPSLQNCPLYRLQSAKTLPRANLAHGA